MGLTIDNTYPIVLQALRDWSVADTNSDSLLFDFYVVRAEWQALDDQLPQRMATNKVLLSCIEEVEQRDPIRGKILRARFLDKITARTVAKTLNYSPDNVNRSQRLGIQMLCEILITREQRAVAACKESLEQRLPDATYSELVGVDALLNSLEEALSPDSAPWIVAITGIGGIGKTAVADGAVRRLVQSIAYNEFVWLRLDPDAAYSTAQALCEQIVSQILDVLPDTEPIPNTAQERERLLRQQLQATPHLIVIDNLESQLDITLLLSYLRSWSEPSKFLLTTRTVPVSPNGLFTVALRELGWTQSADLIRAQAKRNNFTELVVATDEQLREIYAVVGGNPLALKLVVGLAKVIPIPTLLAELGAVNLDAVDTLYRHIYQRAWAVLSNNARSLLQAMPLVAEEGGEIEQLQAISQVNEKQIWSTVTELTAHSLLEVRGGLYARRYGIHRLTMTFLKQDILAEWETLLEAAV